MPTNKKILVAEDDEDLRSVYSTYFQVNNFDVLEAENGYEALSIYQKHHVDIVLTDVCMPKMDGLAFVKKIQSIYGTNKTPIIAVTAKNNEQTITNLRLAGATACFLKPVKLEQLLTIVQSLLSLSSDISENANEIKPKSRHKNQEVES